MGQEWFFGTFSVVKELRLFPAVVSKVIPSREDKYTFCINEGEKSDISIYALLRAWIVIETTAADRIIHKEMS